MRKLTRRLTTADYPLSNAFFTSTSHNTLLSSTDMELRQKRLQNQTRISRKIHPNQETDQDNTFVHILESASDTAAAHNVLIQWTDGENNDYAITLSHQAGELIGRVQCIKTSKGNVTLESLIVDLNQHLEKKNIRVKKWFKNDNDYPIKI